MSVKLYPPAINGTIPAFYGDTITIPYQENKTVGNVSSFTLKIKTVQSNRLIGTIGSTSSTNNTVTFELGKDIAKLLNVGQYYKVQLAYNDGTVGFYSTVGVVKYTTAPAVAILDKSDGFTYFGTYSQKNKDVTEKVYSYQFDLKDSKGNLIETSGEQLHNSSTDVENYESIDSFTLTKELEKNQMYYLTYTVTTINGLQVTSPAKRIFSAESIDSNLKTVLDVQLNYEDGYVDVSLKKPDDMILEESAVGSFYLLRSSSEDDYKSWNEVLNFVLYGQQPSRHLWKDMTVKQGVSYKYAVQQYNAYGLRTNKIESEIIYVDFEHAFLYDGERQLKIKFDPKVSSFKNTVLEQKIDTIGSKYPFIFKNGNVRYKEFSVAGLISLLSDENNLFFELGNDSIMHRTKTPSDRELPSQVIRTTNLTPQNIYNERNFKLEALEWLTNGKPKLFRSPTEGNYIVRLLNVSLSPNDTLGRMLHTFSSTAYEVAEYSYENLAKYEILTTSDPTTQQLRWKTILLNSTNNENLLDNIPASAIKLEGLIAGDKLSINDGTSEYTIVIGATGSYSIDLDKGVSIYSLHFYGGDVMRHQGTLTYAYYSDDFKDSFDTINSIEPVSIPTRQFVGAYEDIISLINDGVKYKLQTISYIRFTMRDTDQKIYLLKVDEKTGTRTYSITPEYMQLGMYEVYNPETEEFLYLLDGYNGNIYEGDDLANKHLNTSIWINGDEENIDLWDTYMYEIRNPSDITSIKTGSAVITEITYQAKHLTYDLENTDELKEAKKPFEEALKALKIPSGTSEEAYQKQCEVDKTWNSYVKALKQAIEKAERR